MNEYLTLAQRQSLHRRRIITWVIVTMIIIGSVFGIYQLSKSSQEKTIDPSILTEDHKLGPDTAKIKLIEYADFQCPACLAAEPMLKQLQADFGDQIQLIYRYFPLKNIHKNAVSSSQAAEAAAKQGKFWEMHDLLFTNQDHWAESNNAADYFSQYAQRLGLNQDQFMSDMHSEGIADKINASYQRALELKLTGTPTMFLNGNQIQTPATYEQFKQIIEDALSQT